jgi:hypothetical protein
MVLSKKILFADVVVSSMLLGLSAWTRGSEPLWMIPVVMTTLILMVKQKWNLLLPYYLIFFLIWQIWPWYVGRGYTPINSVRSVIAKSVIENDIGRYGFLSSIEYTFESILKLLPQSLGLVFYLFIAFFILNIVYRRFSAGQLYYLSVIVMMLSALFLGSLFMVINFHIPIHIYNDSLSRLLSIFVPLMWFYIMINPGWNIISDLFKLKLK